jgi:chemotaxis protein CheD
MPASGNSITVDIADMKISTEGAGRIITYSLGSCIGVTVYDPVRKIGGMIHCMLPMSGINPEKAAQVPYMFVDTGIPAFFNRILELGAEKKDLMIKVAGGAQMLDEGKIFNIGERNMAVLRKILWKNNLLIQSFDVGGSTGRTMTLYMDSGRVTVKINGREVDL